MSQTLLEPKALGTLSTLLSKGDFAHQCTLAYCSSESAVMDGHAWSPRGFPERFMCGILILKLLLWKVQKSLATQAWDPRRLSPIWCKLSLASAGNQNCWCRTSLSFRRGEAKHMKPNA